jgi:hypothetical protein
VGFWVASILNVSLIFAMWWLILDEMGHAFSIPTIVLIAGIVAIVTVVPISLNGLGIFEVATVGAGRPSRGAGAHAFLLALIVRAVFLATSFVGLLSAALLWRERRAEVASPRPLKDS